ncbi:hypothetical protein PS627_00632 [Pseudomonas fluorescens]|uniref:hypothetical protein n=1 Tax=Pseudomonas fluorescens TaxID=294 RepID=UPI001253498A|nr:hypothetical protein [Pseudomonas fluorescens]CAG8863694.1 hypothetical protein PS627_00632 [Pseudomonas fluorescens]VVP70454.1 hypothetical protein PS910_00770 [Pseudomonas fluorescens]
MAFIAVNIRATKVYHGYDSDRQLIIVDLPPAPWVRKLIKVDRILSVTEDYIFIECPHDTVQTWEYEGSLADFMTRLAAAGVAAV